MKKEILQIDQMVRTSLSDQDARHYDELDEQGIFQMWFGLFKGKNAWINILLNVMIIVFFAALIYCGDHFLDATTSEDLIKWGFWTLISFLCITNLKTYAWMQMDKNAILRQVKRLQLQVNSLSSKNSK